MYRNLAVCLSLLLLFSRAKSETRHVLLFDGHFSRFDLGATKIGDWVEYACEDGKTYRVSCVGKSENDITIESDQPTRLSDPEAWVVARVSLKTMRILEAHLARPNSEPELIKVQAGQSVDRPIGRLTVKGTTFKWGQEVYAAELITIERHWKNEQGESKILVEEYTICKEIPFPVYTDHSKAWGPFSNIECETWPSISGGIAQVSGIGGDSHKLAGFGHDAKPRPKVK